MPAGPTYTVVLMPLAPVDMSVCGCCAACPACPADPTTVDLVATCTVGPACLQGLVWDLGTGTTQTTGPPTRVYSIWTTNTPPTPDFPCKGCAIGFDVLCNFNGDGEWSIRVRSECSDGDDSDFLVTSCSTAPFSLTFEGLNIGTCCGDTNTITLVITESP